MEMTVLLRFLWLCSAPALCLGTERQLWYEPIPRTWEEARDFCKSENGDLATVVTHSDIAELRLLDLSSFHAWVGLRKKGSSWWNGDQESSETDVFAEGQPETGHECGKVIHPNQKAYTDDCEQKHFFICEMAIGDFLAFVAEAKTWAEAKTHCEGLNMQLTDSSCCDAAGWQDRLAWPHGRFPLWIGQPLVVFQPGFCPTVKSKNSTIWWARDCSEAFPFVCQRPIKKTAAGVVLKPELLSWEEALEACRNITPLNNSSNFRLLSVEESELPSVLSHVKGATTSKVWVGLRFLVGSWFWSDGAPLSLPSFPLSQCPDPGLHCGALVLSTSSIEPTDCSQKLNVLCHDP